MKKIYILALVVIFALLVAASSLYLLNKNKTSKEPDPQTSQTNQEKEKQDVLGQQIYISGKDEYAAGGLLPLASTDEPAIYVGGYDFSGNVEINLYEADESSLISYLIHDKEGKQTGTKQDISKFRFITKLNHQITSGSDDGSKVLLPLSERGIYFVRVKAQNRDIDSFVVRSDLGVAVKEGDNELIFWGQNFSTRKSVTDGQLKVYNLLNSFQELSSSSFDGEGVTKTALKSEADIAIAKQGSNIAVVPINLRYLNYGYDYKTFIPKKKQTKYFTFTDRPLYRPGDTIHFKSIIRDDDDVRYSIPAGNAKVEIFNGYGDQAKIFEKNVQISSNGTISDSYKLDQYAKTGYYEVKVSIGDTSSYGYFSVEYFRKPEYSIDVTSDKTEVISQDKVKFKISAAYFSGQPLSDRKVTYKIHSADYYEFDFFSERNASQISDDYRYGYWGGRDIKQSSITLNEKGEYELELDTKLSGNSGKSQVYSFEAEIDDGSEAPSFARKNIVVKAGNYEIFRGEGSYYLKVGETYDIPILLAGKDISLTKLISNIKRTSWIPYTDPNRKYTQYREEKEDLKPSEIKTDKDGKGSLKLSPQKAGSYTINLTGNDSKGNTVSKAFSVYSSSQDEPYYNNQQQNISISQDKDLYNIGDSYKVTIYSQIPNRDVFLTFERERVNRYQVVRLNGKEATVTLPVVETDIPNIFLNASSFSPTTLDAASVNIKLSTSTKKLNVKLTPDRKTYGPKDTVKLKVETTNSNGTPIQAETAVWAVDKAIFELADSNAEGVFDAFWQERYENTSSSHSLLGITVQLAEMGGGCFEAGTPILMGDGSTKPIKDVREGDTILTKKSQDSTSLVEEKVVGTHKATVAGYYIINGDLKVTSNHIVYSNGSFKEVGKLQIGDYLLNSKNQEIRVSGIEWQSGKFEVYNLNVQNSHTFFASDYWVHNEKGGGGRTIFKDTAYWNPQVITDSNGQENITFTLPDNLTTWVIASIGSTQNTQVGDSKAEVTVTKSVVVRPIIPNIVREKDEIILSALVQNFTDKDLNFNTKLDFDSGSVEAQDKEKISIASGDFKQIYWKVIPDKENEKAKVTISAIPEEDEKLKDVVTVELPVLAFGFKETKGEIANGEKVFDVSLNPDSDPDKTKISLSASPTILGTLPSAMKYLLNYPYGCVEQTTSRLVPAIIANNNRALFKQSIKDKNINEIIDKGLGKLNTLQQPSGAWSWWSNGKNDVFVTAYVVEYLLEAKKAGFVVDDVMLSTAKNYLETSQFTPEEEIPRNYALTLLNSEKRSSIKNFDNLSPDLLALAVITNYRNGITDLSLNGMAKLQSLAQVQGEEAFWNEGSKINFASKDVSTALAMRAIIATGGDRNLAVKAGRYLTRNRTSPYWSNTFATAQTIQGLVDLVKTGSEAAPSYNLIVSLDDKPIINKMITNISQEIDDIEIPAQNVREEGSKITVKKDGVGQVYSTLLVDEFRTDREAKPVSHPISIKREYVSEKGPEYSLAIGDVVDVKLTLEGLKTQENYIVIQDELPAGLVPINAKFKNEQLNRNYEYDSQVTEKEITQNGAIISLWSLNPGVNNISYKARVVSEGQFITPPVVTSAMYAPELYGRSAAQTVNTTKTSVASPKKTIEDIAQKIAGLNKKLLLILLIIPLGVALIVLKRRGRLSKLSIANIKALLQKPLSFKLGLKDKQPIDEGDNTIDETSKTPQDNSKDSGQK